MLSDAEITRFKVLLEKQLYLSHFKFRHWPMEVPGCSAKALTAGMLSQSLHGRIHGVL